MPKKRKISDFSNLNLEESYQKIELNEYKNYLYQKELDYKIEIKRINDLLKKTNQMIAKNVREK